MKTGSEVPAILTIHKTAPGQYVVRVSNLADRLLAVGVSKLLEDATSLILVSPSDIKVFRASGGASEKAVVASPTDEPTGPEPEVPMESLDAETQAAIREQEGHSLPGDSPVSDSPVSDSGMRVVRRRKPNGHSPAGHPETCGRCRGEGSIKIIDEGGNAGEAPCGVCKGSGVLTRYGAPRH